MVVRYNIPKYGVQSGGPRLLLLQQLRPVQSRAHVLADPEVADLQDPQGPAAPDEAQPRGLRLRHARLRQALRGERPRGRARHQVRLRQREQVDRRRNLDPRPARRDGRVAVRLAGGGERAGRVAAVPRPRRRRRGGGLSSPELPASNSRTEPAGEIDIGGGSWWGGRGVAPRPFDFGWFDALTAPPYNPKPMPRSKRELVKTPTPKTDPTENYKFRKYPEVTLPNGTFPGKVKGKVKLRREGDDLRRRRLPLGPDNASTPMKVTQLQIDPDDEIPPDTWVEVAIANGKTRTTSRSPASPCRCRSGWNKPIKAR
jgi:hypothetical protein